jgi:hypothetical protein
MTDPTAPVTPRTEAGRNLLAFIDRQAPSDANDHEEWVAEWYAWRNDIEHRTLAIEREAGSTDALLCPTGCGCRIGTEDADRADCGCDGPCCWDSWDDFMADVLNRPDYYDEMRTARGLPSALAASDAGPAGIDVERLAEAAWKDWDPHANGFVVDNILDMKNLVARWLARLSRESDR